ncbi:MAG: molybdenum cofactor biosynthesis protein MoaE [Thermoanaerobaculia bacterium]
MTGAASQSGRPSLTREVLDLAPLLAEVADPACGAQAVFLGTVRDAHEGRAVVAIDYSAYTSMAESVLERIAAELTAELPGLRLALRHRLGRLEVGEAAIAIVAASPRRDAALTAIRTALERVKSEVPIWKREIYGDGGSRWREDEPL